jgi:hypothetical protein
MLILVGLLVAVVLGWLLLGPLILPPPAATGGIVALPPARGDVTWQPRMFSPGDGR